MSLSIFSIIERFNATPTFATSKKKPFSETPLLFPEHCFPTSLYGSQFPLSPCTSTLLAPSLLKTKLLTTKDKESTQSNISITLTIPSPPPPPPPRLQDKLLMKKRRKVSLQCGTN